MTSKKNGWVVSLLSKLFKKKNKEQKLNPLYDSTLKPTQKILKEKTDYNRELLPDEKKHWDRVFKTIDWTKWR